MDNQYIKTFEIKELLEITRPTFPDDRGFFKETVRIPAINNVLGYEFKLAQMNHSRSGKNSLRGIHAAPWNKIIYVTKGSVQSVIIDLRKDSSTFGKHQTFIIGEENKSSIFVPAGCGNSYLVLTEEADYTYLTDQEWAPNIEKSVAWNDPDLKIEWNLEVEPILSEKDRNNPPLREIFPEKF